MSALDTAFFWLFALLAVGGGIATVLLRSAVHCAVGLIASLLGVAGLFLLQQAEFLFAAQVVLYVGGVMLLFLFVIMLVNLDRASRERQFIRWWPAPVVALVLLGAEFALLFQRGADKLPAAQAPQTGDNTQQVADVLLRDYFLPFEVISVLLLVAVVGAVLMAKRREA